jgi:tetratricopeptide (TPR) repeat protein
VSGLSILTVRQIDVWHDTRTLWTWVIEKQPGAAIGHFNLGEHLREKGDLDGAAKYWRRAAELEPSFSWPLNQLGNLAVLRGARDEARYYFERTTSRRSSKSKARPQRLASTTKSFCELRRPSSPTCFPK